MKNKETTADKNSSASQTLEKPNPNPDNRKVQIMSISVHQIDHGNYSELQFNFL